MSYFEDYVADGSHCMTCLQYIGDDVGYPRACRGCGGGSESMTHSGEKGAAKRAAKASALKQFKIFLAETGVKHSVHNSGYHYVLTLRDGRQIDCWPTTKKWQLRGSSISRDGKALAQLVRSNK